MILVDTGPLIALFDPADPSHRQCADTLKGLREPLITTVAVLTEACHLLTPDSRGARALMSFVESAGLAVWFMDAASLNRAFELMRQYANVPMDLADASLVAAAEYLSAQKMFTVDRSDFDVYRIKRGHRHVPFSMIS